METCCINPICQLSFFISYAPHHHAICWALWSTANSVAGWVNSGTYSVNRPSRCWNVMFFAASLLAEVSLRIMTFLDYSSWISDILWRKESYTFKTVFVSCLPFSILFTPQNLNRFKFVLFMKFLCLELSMFAGLFLMNPFCLWYISLD